MNDRQSSVETFVHKRKLNGAVLVPIEHHSKLLFRRLAAYDSINRICIYIYVYIYVYIYIYP